MNIQYYTDCGILLLIIAANGAPILSAHLWPHHPSARIDMGRRAKDGQPIFGASKTWRGLCSGLLFPSLIAPLMGWPLSAGLLIGAAAMTGDLASSFAKRRMGLKAQSRATGVDQIPESLLPTMASTLIFPLGLLDLLLIPAGFMALEMMASPLLHKLNLRGRPY